MFEISISIYLICNLYFDAEGAAKESGTQQASGTQQVSSTQGRGEVQVVSYTSSSEQRCRSVSRLMRFFELFTTISSVFQEARDEPPKAARGCDHLRDSRRLSRLRWGNISLRHKSRHPTILFTAFMFESDMLKKQDEVWEALTTYMLKSHD